MTSPKNPHPTSYTSNPTALYPMKFEPILQPMIWGGSDICKFKNRNPIQDGIGESWEISGCGDKISVIANGELSGKSLNSIIQEFKHQLVGEKVYEKFGNTFPLLIKFIDARNDLSIQVHPNDELAKKRHNSFGKTEMWYVINASPTAFLYAGFAQKISPDEYVKMVENNTLTDVLQKFDVQAGDVFFLPAGRVHAIGAGCFVAEIQQTSNITYRIYDYDRKDAQGNKRELHTELAKEAIDFRVFDSYKTEYTPTENVPVKLASCDYFTTYLLGFDKPLKRDYTTIDSFVALICMQGKGVLKDNKNHTISIQQGESVLIPSDTTSIEIIPEKGCKILETFVD